MSQSVDVKYRNSLKVNIDINTHPSVQAVLEVLINKTFELSDTNIDLYERTSRTAALAIYGNTFNYKDVSSWTQYDKWHQHDRACTVELKQLELSARNVVELIRSRLAHTLVHAEQRNSIAEAEVISHRFVTFSLINDEHLDMIIRFLQENADITTADLHYQTRDSASCHNDMIIVRGLSNEAAERTITYDGRSMLFRERIIQWLLLLVNLALLIVAVICGVIGEVRSNAILKTVSSSGTALVLAMFNAVLKVAMPGWTVENMILGRRAAADLRNLLGLSSKPRSLNGVHDKLSRRKILRQLYEMDTNGVAEFSGSHSCWLQNAVPAGGFNMNEEVQIIDLLNIGFVLVISDTVTKLEDATYLEKSCHLFNSHGAEACIRYVRDGVLHANEWKVQPKALLLATFRAHDLPGELYVPERLVDCHIGTSRGETDYSGYKKSRGHKEFSTNEKGFVLETIEQVDQNMSASIDKTKAILKTRAQSVRDKGTETGKLTIDVQGTARRARVGKAGSRNLPEPGPSSNASRDKLSAALVQGPNLLYVQQETEKMRDISARLDRCTKTVYDESRNTGVDLKPDLTVGEGGSRNTETSDRVNRELKRAEGIPFESLETRLAAVAEAGGGIEYASAIITPEACTLAWQHLFRHII